MREVVSKGQKRCSKCREVKSHSEFHKCSSRRDGLQHRCKRCVTRRKRERIPKGFKRCSKCKTIKSISEFTKRNERSTGCASACRKCLKAQREQNKESISLRGKQRWRELPIEKKKAVIAKNRQWLDEHPEHVKQQRKKSPAYMKGYIKRRRLTDPIFRLLLNLRRRVNECLQGRRGDKKGTTSLLIGCSRSELMLHLQNQFRPGMEWNNYGKVWVVDHIKPCKLFNLLEESEQMACFRWSNLQPLFAAENLRKAAKYAA